MYAIFGYFAGQFLSHITKKLHFFCTKVRISDLIDARLSNNHLKVALNWYKISYSFGYVMKGAKNMPNSAIFRKLIMTGFYTNETPSLVIICHL